MPSPNKEAILSTIKIGLALHCKIADRVIFDRKNYFYPDLPKGYQISQHFVPLCQEGYMEINGKKIRIKEIHLEEDTGRLVHDKQGTLVDLNRAGVPLVELVTYPDFQAPQEVVMFGRYLQRALRYLGIADADMEKGQMRLEANVSVATEPDTLGTKVELKNINSFKAVFSAIEYEIERQKEILKQGGKVLQETRGWDENLQKTVSQREKETAHDYRYFPEPDILPLKVTPELVQEIKESLPELPWQKAERYQREYGLEQSLALGLTETREKAEFFEKALKEIKPGQETRKLAELILNELEGELTASKISISDINPSYIAELVHLWSEGEISSRLTKDILKRVVEEKISPREIIEKEGIRVQRDVSEIEKVLREVINENPRAIDDFKKGKETALNFLVGKAMQKTRGQLDPEQTLDLLRKLLSE